MAGTLLGLNMELAQWHAEQEHRRDQELVQTPLLLMEELIVLERLCSRDHAKLKIAQVIGSFLIAFVHPVPLPYLGCTRVYQGALGYTRVGSVKFLLIS